MVDYHSRVNGLELLHECFPFSVCFQNCCGTFKVDVERLFLFSDCMTVVGSFTGIIVGVG